jgi:signal transduction histidine kinase
MIETQFFLFFRIMSRSVKRSPFSLQKKFLVGICLIIIPILGAIFVMVGIQQRRNALEQIRNQARILVRQIILTRKWVSDCGGVMVPSHSVGASGMSMIYNDTLQTPQETLLRYTPAMVTKKLSQYSLEQDMYQFRLASLRPLNPENSPDAFEEASLKKFEAEGIREISRLSGTEEQEVFHYMVPLAVDRACLECHRSQGLHDGAIAGGLSVYLPVREARASLRNDLLKLSVLGFTLVLLTVCTLFVMLRKMVIGPMKELEEMAGEISRGNLDARVNISTEDEFRKLGHAFNGMAEKVSAGRDFLEERIRQATKELSEANRKLQTLDKLKSDFLAALSHELRSPLTVIRGGVDYLNRTIKGENNHKYLAIMDKNLRRLIRLVSDLFDTTKMEANKVQWIFSREDLAGLIREVIEILSPLAVEKGVRVHFDGSSEILVEMNVERIEQVLVNLIENGIKFSGTGTDMHVGVYQEPDSVVVAVRDQGIGIPTQDLQLIFEKFRTLPSSGERGTTQEGTGLGLAICKGIVEAHAGSIWAESNQGRGSVFCFRLPSVKSKAN